MRAAEAGIHRLAIPTPFQVGRINAYLIEGTPLTLIDSGPNSAKALDELEQALAAHGHASRGHRAARRQPPAHRPLRARRDPRAALRRGGRGARHPRARSSGASARQAELDDRFAEEIMLRHGIPPEIVTRAALGLGELPRLGLASVEVTRPLAADGSELELARAHAAGSAPARPQPVGHGLPRRVARSILLAADHLIAHISSNPLLARPLGAVGDYTRPAPAGAADVHRLAARRPARWSSRSCCPATAGRSATTSR